ncbi:MULTISPECIES: response regulator [Rossellomorea]|uniref:response regulator n=1 Tax=Rossellomorea TaxID=2837508 RepID=UPI001CCEB837|nr:MULTISPECIES: response regulator [Rossellomorea]MCA0149410.1 response regulator [Rossellomorea vietnamensis]WGG46780.1 response regulator [Rossellomorea sp. DA94]
MIRIVIAEDKEWVLGTIGALLGLEEDMEVVGKAEDREHALELIRCMQPDLLILDIEHLLRDGPLEVPECRLLVLATFPRDGYLEKVQDAGADGYLLKDTPSEELTSSIRRLMEGTQVYSSKLLEKKEPALYEIPRALGPVKKNYFTMIMDKMKHPTG